MEEILGTLVFLGLVVVLSKGVEVYINSGKPNKFKTTIKNWLTEE